MCKVQMLRALVDRQLTAAVEEIFLAIQGTIAAYEEELSRTAEALSLSKEENERQRQILDALLNPQIERQRADVSQVLTSDEEQHERSSGVKEEEPQPAHIKEEALGHSISQEARHLEGPEDADITSLPSTGVPVKSEDDEAKGRGEEKREGGPSSSGSTRPVTKEADGGHRGGSRADSLLAPLSGSDDTTSHTPDADGEDSCHTCPQCDKTFGSKKSLEAHVILCQSVDKPFVCTLCDKKYSRKDSLITHTRTHTGEKPFSCPVCHTRFSHRSGLFYHMRTHTGEKPFACSVCDQRFSRKECLHTHSRMHTVGNGKPITCGVCEKGFRDDSSLLVHMRVHAAVDPLVCLVCGKRCSTRSILRNHTKTHPGVKKFSCSFCEKKFVRKESLIAHTRLHIGEKPFSCSICNSSFSYHSSLTNHLRLHSIKGALLGKGARESH
ncbi:gastrula zinc finger protein XlCGF57.1-like [Dunckerocampus dactyliophorus]|uniref:gastrula zinc finger protein XlCGF57.1-like n=1 Tax=Dunckerocampus dactyliophorus TaxID=161453 RepID=UPI002404BA5B|nr:gastrula zinc finger protein XlCGF57.1-like [Dunckerocampus dactyliophorus]